jgi:hypothetical protein
MQIGELRTFHEGLSFDLVFFNKCVTLYYNTGHNIELIFKKRNKIYLLRWNIETKKLNSKLNHKKLELFKIKKIIKSVNYKLVFLKTINIYLMFYIFLLELVL